MEVRVRRDNRWGSWHRLPVDDAGANEGSADASTAVRLGLVTSAPLWVGADGDGVAVRVVDRSGRRLPNPPGLHVVLVNGGASAADSEAAVRPAAVAAHLRSASSGGISQPFIYTRRDWGADESIRRHATGAGCGHPKYASSVKVAFVHHTDTPNHYTRREVPAIIRSMYRYHVFGHDWCDIGYNFLIDRFGRIWQGRYGGVTRPVIGAQSGGFNVDSTGVAMIGTFNSVTPDHAMRQAVVRLLAWQLASNYRDPTGRDTLRAGHFHESRYRPGRHVSFRVISGHRNADYTDCPGRRGYAMLPRIRREVMSRLRSGLVNPAVDGSRTWRFGQPGAVMVRSRALRAESWQLNVLDSQGTVVDSQAGSSAAGQSIQAGWDGHTNGFGDPPAHPGDYRLVLTPSRDGRSGVAYTARAVVAPEVTITGPATAAYGSTVTLHGGAIPYATVSVAVSGEPAVDVTATAHGAWSTTFPATANRTWTASAGSGTTQYTTAPGTTAVVPVVTTPRPRDDVIRPPGSTFTLTGTALPLAVSVSIEHEGSALGSATVGGDGAWSTTITVPGRTTISVVAGGGATSPTYTVVPG